MRGDTRGYTSPYGAPAAPRKPFYVIERIRDQDGQGKRTDTITGSMRYAHERKVYLRQTGRPAFVHDRDGRRVEVPYW